MGRWSLKLQPRTKKFWIGFLLLIGGVAAVIKREHENRRALTSPPVARASATPPVEKSVAPKEPPVPVSFPYGKRVDYILKPSPKGTLNLEIDGKGTMYLISDLMPIPCSEKSGKMCLLLKDGRFIEASPELSKKLPIEFRYYRSH